MDGMDRPALITEVGRRAAGSPLDEIEAALAVSDELQSGADELVGHFVTQARHAGCSWTEIGQRLGVSKQAARQRFVRPATEPDEPPERPGLRPARRAGAGQPRRGPLRSAAASSAGGAVQESAAAAIMEQIGLRRDAVRGGT
jgi:hypothetical protein